jgi:hypothetical protein
MTSNGFKIKSVDHFPNSGKEFLELATQTTSKPSQRVTV